MEDGSGLTMPSSEAAIEQHQVAGLSLLLQIVMLGFAFVLGHVLRRHKVHILNEASASLLIGIIVGGIANLSNKEDSFKKWFNFNDEFFFMFLLPPIIFQSGFSLDAKPFFSNFGAICIFAIIGTFIASMVTGVLVFLGGFFFLMYKLSFVESLMFGSLISATDPVTVLGIFQELGTDTNLYALVFGESVLNDVMAISLYRTLMKYWNHPSANYSILSAAWSFLETFAGSMSTGVAVALSCALLFKYAGLSVNSLHNLECCLFVLFPYVSFMLAEGLGLSGIIAILFCGILMKHYAYENLSDNARVFTENFFKLLSSLAETFLFIYMGLDIATANHSWSHAGFIFFSIVFILVARAASVFPCAYVVNLIRPAARRIPLKHQKALWFSGLRGAMAFALALQSMHDLPSKTHGEAIVTTTIAIVVVTVLIFGGSTSTMLEKLNVVGDEYETIDENELQSPASSRFQSSPFTKLDNSFLKRIFTSRSEDDLGLFEAVEEDELEAQRELQRSLIRRNNSQSPRQSDADNTDGRIQDRFRRSRDTPGERR